MSRHETAGSKAITFFRTCSKDVFVEFFGLVRRCGQERGFFKRNTVAQKSRKANGGVTATGTGFTASGGVGGVGNRPTHTSGAEPANYQAPV